jgi:hypothetical protein
MTAACARCQDLAWICEQHQDRVTGGLSLRTCDAVQMSEPKRRGFAAWGRRRGTDRDDNVCGAARSSTTIPVSNRSGLSSAARRDDARRLELGETPAVAARICSVCNALFVRGSKSPYCGKVCRAIRRAVVMRAARKRFLRTATQP